MGRERQKHHAFADTGNAVPCPGVPYGMAVAVPGNGKGSKSPPTYGVFLWDLRSF